MSETSPNRLSFNEAVAYVEQTGKAAFAAMPVFGDDEGDENATAEGARVFLLLPDADEGWTLRFIAGPFFSAAYAANDIIPAEEIPDRVRELLFMPTLLGKLTQAAGIGEQMPDYGSQAARGAGPEAVFPVSFIGGLKKPH